MHRSPISQIKSKALKAWKSDEIDFQKLKKQSSSSSNKMQPESSNEKQSTPTLKRKFAILTNNDDKEEFNPSRKPTTFSKNKNAFEIKRVIIKPPTKPTQSSTSTKLPPSSTVTTTTPSVLTTKTKRTKVDFDEMLKQSITLLDETSNSSSTTTTIIENIRSQHLINMKSENCCSICEEMQGWWCINIKCGLLFYLQKMSLLHQLEDWQIKKIGIALSYLQNEKEKEKEHYLIPCLSCNVTGNQHFTVTSSPLKNSSNSNDLNIHQHCTIIERSNFWNDLFFKNFLCTSLQQFQENIQQNL